MSRMSELDIELKEICISRVYVRNVRLEIECIEANEKRVREILAGLEYVVQYRDVVNGIVHIRAI